MDKYRRVRVIGRGSFGCAILCRRKRDNHQCVIKQIQTDGMDDSEHSAVTGEVRILSSLDHPNIIRLLDSFHVGKMVCILMEYADQGDLYVAII
jgi:serine/threonine protein kinase